MLRTKTSMLTLAALVLFIGAVAARAQSIQIDEKGHGFGTVGQGYLSNDPGPDGKNNVLTYNLPFTGVQGDVLIQEGGARQDLIRFNGDGTVIFYSACEPGLGQCDDPADLQQGPAALYANQVRITEVGPEGDNFALYTPTAGQPGFNPAAPGTSYKFISDGALFGDTFQVNYFAGANGARPDQTVRITNPGTAQTDGATGSTLDLCANIYVFRNDQQLAECCSCLVTPNGLRTLSIDFDLAHNPLTPGAIGEGVIKIVSSPVPTGGCNPAVAGSAYTPVAALRAWGTHNQDVSGGLQGSAINQVTETHFLDATLSGAELSELQSNCGFINSQGSGHGICTCGRGD